MAICKICAKEDGGWPEDWTNWICPICELDEHRTFIDPIMRTEARDSGCCPYCETLLEIRFGAFICCECERVY